MPNLTATKSYPPMWKAEFGLFSIDTSLAKSKIAEGTAPFSKLCACNLGNPQGVGMTPISYLRDLISAMSSTRLLDQNVFDETVKARAEFLLTEAVQTGAYTDAHGMERVRQSVADYIAQRDGYPCDFNTVMLSDGATPAIQQAIRTIIRGPQDAILVPCPQYPLYNAYTTCCEGVPVPYYLDEDNHWGLSVEEIAASVNQAESEGLTVRALVVINPGNPTGCVLDVDCMESIVRFCHDHEILLLADEVYQRNVYSDERPFVSFKKVVCDLEQSDDRFKGFELISFHSTSKGLVGEAGRRGGYMELYNIDDQVIEQLILLTSMLCTNVDGQIALDAMIHPPQPGDAAYPLWKEETDAAMAALKQKAVMVSKTFNSMPGMFCYEPEGAMYVFPRIEFPQRWISHCLDELNKEPDAVYCQAICDELGLVVVPGSVFGQKPGTYHIRMTILPEESLMQDVMGRWVNFHETFMNEWQ